MNVQQSKQMKITRFAAALLLAFVLALLPRVAFAEVVNETTDPAPEKPVAAEVEKTVADTPAAPSAQEQKVNEPSEEKKVEEVTPTEDAEEEKVEEADATPTQKAYTVQYESAGAISAQAVTEQNATLNAQSAPAVLTAQATRTSTANVGLSYNTHVQNDGWKGYVSTGQVSGTSGRSLRLEGIHIKLTGMGNNTGSVNYQVHVQNDGWQKAVSDGAMSGTSGRSLRLEGIKIWLSGDIANHYDILYRTHVQNIGWQDWVKNGALAGTTGRSLRLEAIQIALSPKTAEAASGASSQAGVSYVGHVQNVGWQDWVNNGATAGTSGRSLRVEALNMVLIPGKFSGSIVYQAHVQNIGWQREVRDGKTAGTSGESLRVEGLRIHLTGGVAGSYNVYYRTHVQNYGWLDWASNGADSGSTGMGLRIEAVQVKLVPKGQAAPGPTKYTTANQLVTSLNGIDIASWQAGINLYKVPADFVIVKATGGTGYTNPYWKGMANDTLNSGKLLGLYHFARESGCRGSATAEADYFVNAISGYVGKAVLVLDYEAEAIDQGPGWAKAWLDRVYQRTGVRPMIYMSKSVANSQNWSQVAPSYKLWGAQYLYRYYNNPQTGYVADPELASGWGPWGKPTIYQYNSTSYLVGWDSSLDMNKFYGNQNDWRKLAAKS